MPKLAALKQETEEPEEVKEPAKEEKNEDLSKENDKLKQLLGDD